MSTFAEEKLAYMQAHIDDSRVVDIYWIYCSAIVVAVSSTTLRVLAKTYTSHGISVEDYLAILATVCISGESVVNFITGTPYGLGRHIIAVKSPQDLQMILLGEFIFTEINTWSTLLVKLTILSFYHRVFPNPRFQRIVLGMLVFMILWHTCVWGVTTFGCYPVKKWWVDKEPGHCINLLPFGIVANLINILSDFFIFLMPIPILWKLKISIRRRIMLCIVFAMGLATCALTIIRVLAIFRSSADFTWDNIPIAAYYVFEPVGGLLCINIPFITRAILRKMRSGSSYGSKNSRSYVKSIDPEQNRQQRQSRWLRGIDNIQLTNMSSRRQSMIGGVDVQQRPWIPITKSSSNIDRTPPAATGLNEVVISKPEESFHWDEVLVGDGSRKTKMRSNHDRSPAEEAIAFNRTKPLPPETHDRG